MNKVIKFATLVSSCFLSLGAIAQADPINVVTTATPFLRISPDARAGGMGELGIATSPDANSGFWNNAKTVFATKKAGVSLTYTPWLKDIGVNDVYFATVGGYYKLDDKQAITGSLRYFSLGSIQFTDINGVQLNTFNPKEFSIDAGYSRKLSDKNSIGLTARFINSSLANGTTSGTTYKPGNSVSADLSYFHKGEDVAGNGLNYGVTLSNLGQKIGYTNSAADKDFIPANLGIGFAYNKITNEVNKLTFGIDINKLLVPTPPGQGASAADITAWRSKGVVSSWFSSFGDAPGGFKEEIKEFSASIGAEYTYNNQFAFRGGYFYEAPTKGNRKYFTLGAGLKYNNLGMNFAYLIPSGGNAANRNPLSNTIRFSVLFDLGSAAAVGE